MLVGARVFSAPCFFPTNCRTRYFLTKISESKVGACIACGCQFCCCLWKDDAQKLGCAFSVSACLTWVITVGAEFKDPSFIAKRFWPNPHWTRAQQVRFVSVKAEHPLPSRDNCHVILSCDNVFNAGLPPTGLPSPSGLTPPTHRAPL